MIKLKFFLFLHLVFVIISVDIQHEVTWVIQSVILLLVQDSVLGVGQEGCEGKFWQLRVLSSLSVVHFSLFKLECGDVANLSLFRLDGNLRFTNFSVQFHAANILLDEVDAEGEQMGDLRPLDVLSNGELNILLEVEQQGPRRRHVVQVAPVIHLIMSNCRHNYRLLVGPLVNSLISKMVGLFFLLLG